MLIDVRETGGTPGRGATRSPPGGIRLRPGATGGIVAHAAQEQVADFTQAFFLLFFHYIGPLSVVRYQLLSVVRYAVPVLTTDN